MGDSKNTIPLKEYLADLKAEEQDRRNQAASNALNKVTEADVVANPEFQKQIETLRDAENTVREAVGMDAIPAFILREEVLADLKPTNPKDLIATTKIDLSLFPHTAVAHGALALMEGHLKYGAYNWRVGGILTSVYLAALRRHIAKFENGELEDPTTRVTHLGNALACIAILIDGFEVGCIKDDRPPAHPDIAGMYDRLEEKVKHLLKVFPPENSPGRFTEKQHGKEHSSETLRNSVGSRGTVPNRSGD
jgi:hypothetical protein